jgi:Ca-activated chloride channel family protein
MHWFKSLGSFEYISIGIFIIAYLIYIFRVYRLSRFLGNRHGSVIPKLLLRTGLFALIIIALLGPSFGNDSKEIKSVGKDIMIAVDLSQSMNAVDIQPSRLEKVKYELNNIVEQFNSDRIGLIIFSSEAFIQCPLTYDQSALNLFIETLNSQLVPRTGTDFGPALRLALEKLDSEDESSIDAKAKIIILISDGEDFGDKTSSVRTEIKNRGIKLFTLGVGTTQGSKISTTKGFKKDQNGNDVISKLNRKSLKELAARTGGKYFEINQRQNDVSRLINTINSVEGQLRDARMVDVSANKYIYFLLAALILLVMDLLTTIKTIRI